MNDYVLLKSAAKQIGITTGRIRQLIKAKEVHGKKFGGRDWWIPAQEVEEMKKNPAKTGRPRSGKK